MGSGLYDSFTAHYYHELPVVKGRVQDVAIYRDAARVSGDPMLGLGCGTGPVTQAGTTDGREVRIAERVAAFHRAAERNAVEMIFPVVHPGGRQEKLVFAGPVRYFFRYEVAHLLARSGFKVAAEYGDFDHTPIRDDSPEMIFVAEAR